MDLYRYYIHNKLIDLKFDLNQYTHDIQEQVEFLRNEYVSDPQRYSPSHTDILINS